MILFHLVLRAICGTSYACRCVLVRRCSDVIFVYGNKYFVVCYERYVFHEIQIYTLGIFFCSLWKGVYVSKLAFYSFANKGSKLYASITREILRLVKFIWRISIAGEYENRRITLSIWVNIIILFFLSWRE